MCPRKNSARSTGCAAVVLCALLGAVAPMAQPFQAQPPPAQSSPSAQSPSAQSPSTQPAAPALRVATGFASPFVLQSGGAFSGFSIDLWNVLAQRMGVTSRFIDLGRR